MLVQMLDMVKIDTLLTLFTGVKVKIQTAVHVQQDSCWKAESVIHVYQVVHSRALAVPGPEGVIVPMLVPMLDMFNHDSSCPNVR